ncbi:MAG: hypothetical protein CM15mP71_7100 [Candidatus Poseidoniales archaeon]|nr:MAG: hypothetical protein CM15mP71_7100 [Candidatus Poseidoniales archaeon]
MARDGFPRMAKAFPMCYLSLSIFPFWMEPKVFPHGLLSQAFTLPSTSLGMGKFYDGSGEEFSPLGGRPLHVEGHTS